MKESMLVFGLYVHMPTAHMCAHIYVSTHAKQELCLSYSSQPFIPAIYKSSYNFDKWITYFNFGHVIV